ncbi:glycoside hydrolase family 88 protein [uncultured Bacteroides sp.]|uniref:glycoside hydrolase family 88 protein n=1 Tax=uncultured Bacteroides sp. TaxID=162156 RepID=UPI0025F2CC3F|nr:glycoside hydrolase family 88 protein [uncultured Bacteroides sp.]
MNFIITMITWGMSLMSSSYTNNTEPIETVIYRGLDRSVSQTIQMAKKLENEVDKLPRTIENGKLKTINCFCWCSGFFPGELWYLCEYTRNPQIKKYAKLYTARLEKVQYVTGHHDVGFMLYCSYGNGFRLTANKKYKKILEQGARSLSTRYNPTIKAIRSWDFGSWQFPVIIDNMMNLELLTWAGKETGDKTFYNIATDHANTTMNNHFREDYSSYHVVSYDTITGLAERKQTFQGSADESAWARGQAWALYGYTMMARETGDKSYLEQAKKVASFVMDHPNMPVDKVPYWDFDAPEIPNTPRDASSAAIMASALIELSQIDKSADSDKYLSYAKEQIRSLTSPNYLAEEGTNCNFILKHSTGHFRGNSEIDVPICYADYYYIEALMRLYKLLGLNNEDK